MDELFDRLNLTSSLKGFLVKSNSIKLFALCLLSYLLSSCAIVDKIKDSSERDPATESVSKKETPSQQSDAVQNQSDAEYHFAMGETYSLEGLPQKAAEQFKLALVFDPNSSTVRLKLAVEYLKMGLASEAITQAEAVVEKSAVDKDKKNAAEAYTLLGGLYSSIKVYDKAIFAYEKVIELDKTKAPESKLYLGAVYAEKGDYDKSIKIFTEITKLKEKAYHHLAHYYMGRIYLQKDQPKKAIESFNKSIQAKTDFEDAVVILGDTYIRENQRMKAKKLLVTYQDQFGPSVEIAKTLSQIYLEDEDYDHAYNQYEIIQASEPSNLNVKIRLALISIEKKDYDKAIYKLKEILALAPDSDKVRFYLAAVYEELKVYNDAIDSFNKIEPSSQFYGEAKVHSAYLQKVMGQPLKSIQTVEEAISKKPDYPQFYALYASLLDDQKDYLKAERVLTTAIQKFPEDDQLYFFLGSVQDKLGKREETITSMKKVILLNEKHYQALNYLAYTYAELGRDLDKAEDLARKALALNPGDAYIKDTVGWVLFKKGKISDAVKVLESAHKTQPNESIIAEHLGDAYYQYQLFDKAKDMYEKAAATEKDVINAQKIKTKILEIKRVTAGTNQKGRLPASVTGE